MDTEQEATMKGSGFEMPVVQPSVFRRRWRLFLGIAIVVLAIVAMIFTPSVAHPGIVLVAFIAIVALIISGNRRGGGGINHQHYQSGNTGNGA